MILVHCVNGVWDSWSRRRQAIQLCGTDVTWTAEPIQLDRRNGSVWIHICIDDGVIWCCPKRCSRRCIEGHKPRRIVIFVLGAKEQSIVCRVENRGSGNRRQCRRVSGRVLPNNARLEFISSCIGEITLGSQAINSSLFGSNNNNIRRCSGNNKVVGNDRRNRS